MRVFQPSLHVDKPQRQPGPDWHAMPLADIFRQLQCDEQGLTQEQVLARRESVGPNQLPELATRSLWRRFLAQCHNVLIYVLLAAALIVMLLQHWVDAGVILGVVVINATIGLLQEGKAEQAIRALKTMLSSQALTLRDGIRSIQAARELVPGDIVFLQAGDKVPADIRLIHTKNLQIQEAALTGESLPVEKSARPNEADTLLADRSCMAYSGTLVTFGRAKGVVVETGITTELGRITTLLSEVHKLTTPLLRQLAKFSQQLSVAIVMIALITLLVGYWGHGFTLSDMFLAAVSVAVAAIPEGLPAIMSITLAIGVQKMASRNAIIRSLPAVETLGSVTVICTDKTGTLTRNEMMVTELIAAGEGHFQVSGSGYDPHGVLMANQQEVEIETHPQLAGLILAGVVCNDARLSEREDSWVCEGDPTDGALLSLGAKAGFSQTFESEARPRLDVIPFESMHGYMATLHHDHHGAHTAYVKGAPELLLSMCEFQADPLGPQPLDNDFWIQQLQRLAEQGLRVLAIAKREFDVAKEELTFSDLRTELVLLGLVGMIDPPRQDAISAVRQCQSAGISIKMITGDHAVTAEAIASQMAITPMQVMTGQQIEKLTDVQLQQAVREFGVFARSTPEHKLRLVEALQANGEVVAMTGDGVNDAPALKRADIGVAMGCNGTEVAREAAEMVLTDDNFSSIVDAVEEGRTVYDNLTKGILFILPTSAGEALIIIAAILLGEVLPITPVQILWVNMITAVTLALALAFEPGEKLVMRRNPRAQSQPILTPGLIWRVLFVSLIMMAGSFSLFIWHVETGSDVAYARTVAVNTLVMFEVFYLFNARFLTESVLNRQGIAGNRYILLAILVLLLFQLSYTYLGAMQFLFGSVSLDWHSWISIVLVSSSVFWLVEFEKWCLRRWGMAHK